MKKFMLRIFLMASIAAAVLGALGEKKLMTTIADAADFHQTRAGSMAC